MENRIKTYSGLLYFSQKLQFPFKNTSHPLVQPTFSRSQELTAKIFLQFQMRNLNSVLYINRIQRKEINRHRKSQFFLWFFTQNRVSLQCKKTARASDFLQPRGSRTFSKISLPTLYFQNGSRKKRSSELEQPFDVITQCATYFTTFYLIYESQSEDGRLALKLQLIFHSFFSFNLLVTQRKEVIKNSKTKVDQYSDAYRNQQS